MTVTIDNDLNAVSAGGATPGGADTEVQYNDGGSALGGDPGLTYNKTTNVLTNTGGNIVNSQAVAVTSTDGVVLQTSATATSGNQKWSPRIRMRGSYFSGSAKTTDFIIENQATASGGTLQVSASDNGGAYSFQFGADGSGNLYGANAVAVGTPGTVNYLMVTGSQVYMKSDATISWSSGSNPLTPDTYLYRAAAANLRLGAAAANPPVAQTTSVQNASGTDIAGAARTYIASLGTGAGTPGTHVFQTGATLGTGTTLQTATTRFTIAETRLTAAVPVVLPSYVAGSLPTGAAGMRAFCTDANATTFASIVAGGGANGVPVYHDGTNWRIG